AVEEHAAREDLRAFLQTCGFEETRRVWDLRLGVAEAPDLAPEPPAGVRIATLAAERARDRRCLERLHGVVGRASAEPVRPPAFDEREARLWLDRPCVPHDGYFIAVAGDEYVGVCDVNRCGAAPGQLVHGFTGVVPERRRQGIGTALVRAAIRFARAGGYSYIRAFVRPDQADLLALDEKVGFRRRWSSVTLEKCLRATARVDPAVYDAYVGRYQGEPGPTLVVTKEDGRLFAELSGQKVEPYPESERTFFVKWFYGRAEFEPERLIWRHREPQGREVVICAQRTG